MKKISTLFLLFLLIYAAQGQVSPGRINRTNTAASAFSDNLAKYGLLVNDETTKLYLILQPILGSNSVNTCSPSQLRDLGIWQTKRRLWGRWIDGSANIDSVITIAYLDTTTVLKKTTAAAMYQPKGNYLSSYTETDPTISAWAKAAAKPTYTAAEVGAEPAFSKNTGFNKNFGTVAGTVLEGRTFGTAANSATTDFAAASHTHSYLPLSGGTLTGALYGTSASFSSTITASDHILSDIRLKRNIQRLGKLDFFKVKDIRFIKYTMKADSTNNIRYGVSAQQVENVLPEVVYTDEKGTKSVAYIDMLVLIAAQQKNEIDSLKIKVRYLEGIVKKLIELQ